MASSWKLSHVVLLVGIVVLAGCAGVVPDDPTSADPSPNNESPTPSVNGTVEVHYINVGQSVSTLVIGPDGETMLIDTGHYTDDGEYVLEYLQRHEITQLDHLVTSHNDADHIGGNAAIIEYYETEAEGIGAVYDPGIAASTETYAEYLDAVEEHDVTLYETREGDTISFGEVDIDVLGPPDPYLENEARNENSIVLKLTYGETSFLLSGDAEDDQEAYLIDTYGAELQSTVLKAGHHGS
jgi:competence protein ComEC